MGQLTRSIGEFIAGMNFDAIPGPAVGAVKNALSDYSAVVILGRDEPVTRLIASFENVATNGEARVLFSNQRADGRAAALINGTSGHAHDYDDVGIAFHPAHPSVAIAPSIFAQAEAIGASGRDLITAFVTAYEVWSELASRDEDPQHLKGWHPTGSFGAIAAAAGAAKLLRLDAEASMRAVAIAASQASGIVANFGTMTKPLHAGRAAAAGLMAARYARAGMTASPDIFEHKNGFLTAVSPRGKLDLKRPAHFGKTWHIADHGVSVKLYPMCYGTHRILGTLTDYAAKQNLQADDISGVSYRTGPSRVIPLVHTNPKSALDAKFSAEFAVAMAVIARRATLAELNDNFVNRADVRALMGKVTRDLDPELDKTAFNKDPDDELVFTMRDGSSRRLKLGSPRDQAISLDRETLWTKFQDCTAGAMDARAARDLFDTMQTLEKVRSVAEIPAPSVAMTQAAAQ